MRMILSLLNFTKYLKNTILLEQFQIFFKEASITLTPEPDKNTQKTYNPISFNVEAKICTNY